MYENYAHTDACRHTPPPEMLFSFPPLTGPSGIVVYTAPDAVAVVEREVAKFACNHTRTIVAETAHRVRFARKFDADCIGFIGPLDDEACEALANVGATGYVVLVAAPGQSYDAVVSRLLAADDGSHVYQFTQG